MDFVSEQYLYRLQLVRPALLTDGPTEEEAETIQQHVAYLQKFATDSTVLLAGRTQADAPEVFGIVILRVATEEKARDIMNNDPAVKYGVMTADIFPFSIAVLSKEIASLKG